MTRVSLPRRSAKAQRREESCPENWLVPWNIGRFYGSSYFVDSRGNFIAMGSDDKDELVVAEMDLDMIENGSRVRQSYRDRRPETCGSMAEQLP